ncbi:uncharacterized protein LOC112271031 [Brachypodium distachyon]|nr:uncharacterized protein LOC112271031 [Brachypodium distachyon]|eukprot:XP_024315692.1 uncharacterized protein LOC112271031 [Brachypodium distachyon]
MNATNLVRSWKNSNIPLRFKDYRTVVFKRTYQRKNNAPEEEDIEVTVFLASERENIPWSQARVEYVVDSIAVTGETDTTEPKVINDKKLVHCLTRFPKVAQTFGLLFDRQEPRFTRPCCRLTIVATSLSSVEVLTDSFPQWDKTETSMSFFADGSAEETSSFDLIVTLSTSSSNKRLGNGTTTSDSFTALLRTCIDMIRLVPLPIVRCRLVLF